MDDYVSQAVRDAIAVHQAHAEYVRRRLEAAERLARCAEQAADFLALNSHTVAGCRCDSTCNAHANLRDALAAYREASK